MRQEAVRTQRWLGGLLRFRNMEGRVEGDKALAQVRYLGEPFVHQRQALLEELPVLYAQNQSHEQPVALANIAQEHLAQLLLVSLCDRCSVSD